MAKKKIEDSKSSAEAFADIYSRLEETVLKIATELQDGNADARPLDYGGESPCKYCTSKPICRNANN